LQLGIDWSSTVEQFEENILIVAITAEADYPLFGLDMEKLDMLHDL